MVSMFYYQRHVFEIIISDQIILTAYLLNDNPFSVIVYSNWLSFDASLIYLLKPYNK